MITHLYNQLCNQLECLPLSQDSTLMIAFAWKYYTWVEANGNSKHQLIMIQQQLG
jgi:hypothetical protein